MTYQTIVNPTGYYRSYKAESEIRVIKSETTATTKPIDMLRSYIFEEIGAIRNLRSKLKQQYPGLFSNASK